MCVKQKWNKKKVEYLCCSFECILFSFLLLSSISLRLLHLIVSTGSIRWILWFSVCYAAAARREIFGVNALRGKQQQLGSPNLQDIFIGG